MIVLIIVLVFLALGYGVLMILYRYGWQHLPEYRISKETFADIRVSIIIPARNEADHIQPCLQAICRQHYPAHLMEIIVVDDQSTDDTAARVLAVPDARIRLLQLQAEEPASVGHRAPKKKAIEMGIAHAQGELIVTTDADCVAGPNWIGSIVSFYRQHQAQCIAAPVIYSREQSFFDIFQSLDFMTMQGITGATVHLHIGTMCNGANLAYTRRVFEEVDGFTGIDGIASGDDMLLMYKIYHAYPDRVFYLKCRESIVYTLPVKGWRSFWHQRLRWASKANKFDDKRLTYVLAGVYVWNLCFVLLALLGFYDSYWWLIAAFLLMYKTIVELYFLFPVAKFFRKKRFLWYFFPGQFLHIPYIVSAGLAGVWSTYQWKGRKLK
ncbi:MAG: glycosyltransferase [Thermoflavifilum sp.]|nr:glycosyltransferase [Thermoflavifilum sp.]